MIDLKFLDGLAQQLADAMPTGARELGRDVEKNMRATLQSVCSRLNLVSREEFDVQAAVLARTRARLKLLEAQVAAFEEQLKVKSVRESTVAGDVN